MHQHPLLHVVSAAEMFTTKSDKQSLMFKELKVEHNMFVWPDFEYTKRNFFLQNILLSA